MHPRFWSLETCSVCRHVLRHQYCALALYAHPNPRASITYPLIFLSSNFCVNSSHIPGILNGAAHVSDKIGQSCVGWYCPILLGCNFVPFANELILPIKKIEVGSQRMDSPNGRVFELALGVIMVRHPWPSPLWARFRPWVFVIEQGLHLQL